MKKILTLTIFMSLAVSGCRITETSGTRDQGLTPQTTRGKFYSCMQSEAHKQKDEGKLNSPNLDIWTTAQEIQTKCQRKLKLSKQDINETQNIEIIVSTIKSLR